MIRVTREPIDPAVCLEAFCAGGSTVGAVVSFCGRVRDAADAGGVDRLTLQAYPGFTEKVMGEIEAEARARFDIQDVLAVHRWGEMRPGETIIFAAAASRHRRAAFEAVDFLMDQFKTRAPFWKKEDGPGGTRWIEPRVDDYQALSRWVAEEDAPHDR